MFSSFAQALDRLAIQAACSSIPAEPNTPPQLDLAQAFIARPDYFELQGVPAADLTFTSDREFVFSSPFKSPWPENNLVRGKLYRAGNNWKQRPVVVLLHGWNGESGYDWHFPYLTWRLNRLGLSAVVFELPYHAQRKPPRPAPVRNFISHDFLRMAEAVHQSLRDATALLNWLLREGVPAAGLWGVSLGAWLTGLLACYDPRWQCAVMVTPVVRMDQAFDQLRFCAPISRGQQGLEQTLQRFNLAGHQPRLPAERLLIVESQFDRFAPPETVEELWRTWRRPEIWRYPHGHISILMSLPIMGRTTQWARRKLLGLS